MIPKELRLPDFIRDRLEEGLLAAGKDNAQAKQCVLNAFFPLQRADGAALTEKERDWTERASAAFTGMSTGAGAPAFMLTNLPPTQAKRCIQALFLALGDSQSTSVSSINVADRGELYPHRDYNFIKSIRMKLLQAFFCAVSDGTQPTVFVTADEAIHMHVCRLLGLDSYVPMEDINQRGLHDSYAQEEAQFVKRLLDARVIKSDGEVMPFLYENPNYRAGGEAPRWIAYDAYGVIRRSDRLQTPDQQDAFLEYHDALTRAGEYFADHSPASRVVNTAVCSNGWVQDHARPKHQSHSGQPISQRLIVRYDALPQYEGPTTVLSQAIAPVVSRLQLPDAAKHVLPRREANRIAKFRDTLLQDLDKTYNPSHGRA